MKQLQKFLASQPDSIPIGEHQKIIEDRIYTAEGLMFDIGAQFAHVKGFPEPIWPGPPLNDDVIRDYARGFFSPNYRPPGNDIVKQCQHLTAILQIYVAFLKMDSIPRYTWFRAEHSLFFLIFTLFDAALELEPAIAMENLRGSKNPNIQTRRELVKKTYRTIPTCYKNSLPEASREIQEAFRNIWKKILEEKKPRILGSENTNSKFLKPVAKTIQSEFTPEDYGLFGLPEGLNLPDLLVSQSTIRHDLIELRLL